MFTLELRELRIVVLKQFSWKLPSNPMPIGIQDVSFYRLKINMYVTYAVNVNVRPL